MKNLLAPLEPPYPGEVADILAAYPKSGNGYILRLFRVFANSLRFLRNKGVVNLLDDDSPLSLREREIVILRVTSNQDCEYEWGVHVSAFARAAGFTDEQVKATRLAGADAPCWSERESLLVRCIDELSSSGALADETCAAFQRHWSAPQQLEILALCGNYHTVSFVANTSRVPLEDFAARFPRA